MSPFDSKEIFTSDKSSKSEAPPPPDTVVQITLPPPIEVNTCPLLPQPASNDNFLIYNLSSISTL